jgi:hypothetical protein
MTAPGRLEWPKRAMLRPWVKVRGCAHRDRTFMLGAYVAVTGRRLGIARFRILVGPLTLGFDVTWHAPKGDWWKKETDHDRD